MNTFSKLLAAALTATVLALPAASAQTSLLQTYDASGGYHTNLLVDANQGGEMNDVYLDGGDLGISAASGTDVTAQLELVSVTAPAGISVTLDGAVATNMNAWTGNLVGLDLYAVTDGTLFNGVYPVVVTVRNTVTGETAQFSANVVVTENAE